MSQFMFTSESVTEGHPDKLCDRISDAIVDRVLSSDPRALVVAETAISSGIVFVAARMRHGGGLDVPALVRDVIRRAGYTQEGFDFENCAVMTSITQLTLPSEPMDETRDEDEVLDAMLVRDQATIFGYACDHTPELMPMPIWLAHRLARRLSEVRADGTLPWLAPDAKCQAGIVFDDRRPVGVHSIAIQSCQQPGDAPGARAQREALMELVVKPVLASCEAEAGEDTRYFLNPGGPVLIGGPAVHSGMTGRKNGVDTYGEFSRYSDSALSGKDPTRIDRVGAYAARHAAKNVVAAGLASECEVQLSYTIGVAGPVSVEVDTYGTGSLPDSVLADRVKEVMDFRLAAILRRFGLRRLPEKHDGRFYEHLASYGQVGRVDIETPWEETDFAERFK